jgi:uncharacterized protein
MSGLHRFDLATQPVTPWKNGGGTTQVLASGGAPGAAADAFDWRVSVARIEADGPFSRFPGVDRVIVLLDGGGVRLCTAAGDLAGIDHRLAVPFEPFAFPGEAQTVATCLGADGQRASRDFNVMTRRAALRARVAVLRDAAALPPAGHGLLLAATGSWSLQGNGALHLATGDGAWWQGSPRGWHARPTAALASALIFVHWEPASP